MFLFYTFDIHPSYTTFERSALPVTMFESKLKYDLHLNLDKNNSEKCGSFNKNKKQMAGGHLMRFKGSIIVLFSLCKIPIAIIRSP
jgi:hypothetical protein